MATTLMNIWLRKKERKKEKKKERKKLNKKKYEQL